MFDESAGLGDGNRQIWEIQMNSLLLKHSNHSVVAIDDFDEDPAEILWFVGTAGGVQCGGVGSCAAARLPKQTATEFEFEIPDYVGKDQ